MILPYETIAYLVFQVDSPIKEEKKDRAWVYRPIGGGSTRLLPEHVKPENLPVYIGHHGKRQAHVSAPDLVDRPVRLWQIDRKCCPVKPRDCSPDCMAFTGVTAPRCLLLSGVTAFSRLQARISKTLNELPRWIQAGRR